MEHYIKVAVEDLALFGNLKTFTCPLCNKLLIDRLNNEKAREFYCECNNEVYIIDIVEDED